MNRLPITTTCKISMSAPQKVIYINKSGRGKSLSTICHLSLDSSGRTIVMSALPSLPYAVSGVDNSIISCALFMTKNGIGNGPSGKLCYLGLNGPRAN